MNAWPNSNEGVAHESRRHQLQWQSGKNTLVDNLLAPRMNPQKFEIETINAGSSGSNAERLKGEDYGGLQVDLMTLDSPIVDVGASNV
ncbi:putative plasmid stable inheritance protein (plasmid) [Caballeronia insecticola]|uniref:Putative plasmid stable inheritance protein n=1 Tax=Caballeronia insecticola TaxID=758793 RepID=A0A060PJJ2_9BURK|nr:putative plasmid stable inheritance protein [Caballeronia insecticola]